MPRRKKSVPKISSEYTPSAEEHALVESVRERSWKILGLKIEGSGTEQSILIDHPDKEVGVALLANALGASDLHFLGGVLDQLARASLTNGVYSKDTLNFLLSVVKGVEPRDQIESMLAAQMAMVHVAIMKFAGHSASAENILQQESAERASNRLIRTFAALVETLKRHRTGGEQKMTIQHVNVSEGGQAIVGNVTQAGHQNGSDKPTPAARTKARTDQPSDDSINVPARVSPQTK